MIEKVERYITMGKEFSTHEKAIEYREGLIEKFLMECPGFYQLLPKDRTAFVEHFIENRFILMDLLNYKRSEIL